jgi:uncharacterized protein with ParB-like and HNH nuclease domain
MRRKLIENIVQKRPVPAIFLYRQDAGAKVIYNILDGKQRMESLLLFIGKSRDDLKVKNVEHYFYGLASAEHMDFEIEIDHEMVAFRNLKDEYVRNLRTFSIATVEIDLDDEQASFHEVVNLFIDINQQGKKVTRFDVVKALGNDPIFQQVFKMVGKREIKKRSRYFIAENNSFTNVLGRLNIIKRLADDNSKVDRMWERLTEIALFLRTKQHRSPAEILKAFIVPDRKKNKKLTEEELAKFRQVFGFLADAYRTHPRLAKSGFASDQPSFYTLVTTLLSTTILDDYSAPQLKKRLENAAKFIEGDKVTKYPKVKKMLSSYEEAATKQTTHPGRRETRQEVLLHLIQNPDA